MEEKMQYYNESDLNGLLREIDDAKKTVNYNEASFLDNVHNLFINFNINNITLEKLD